MFHTVDQRASDFVDLQRKITTRLQDKGPANIETLATELNVPQPKVWFALQKLHESGTPLIESRPDGTWDLVGIYRIKKRRAD